MNVSLTPELEQKVRDLVETGQYSSSSEVVRDALRRFEPIRSSFRQQQFDQLIQEARAELADGEGSELTQATWDEITTAGTRMANDGDPIPWHISGEDPE